MYDESENMFESHEKLENYIKKEKRKFLHLFWQLQY